MTPHLRKAHCVLSSSLSQHLALDLYTFIFTLILFVAIFGEYRNIIKVGTGSMNKEKLLFKRTKNFF